MRTPRTLDIEVTARCNLRCTYCYFFHNPEVDYQDLPTNEWLTFFDELGSLGVMNVTLAGGEPFIRDDLTILLEGIIRNRMRFSLLSNGMLINDEIAALIARTGRCGFVQVSVDGSCAEIHDSCRGKGSFDGAIRGIHTLLRHGINVAVRVTIHQYNVRDIENIARLLLVELGLPSFGTNSAGYLGTCRLNADDVLLDTQERQVAMSTLLRLTEKYHGRIRANAGPLAEGRMWRRMEQARAHGAPAFPNGGRLTSCGCSRNKLAVRSDGAIVLCNMLAHSELGRINRDSLADIWQHSPTLNRLRDRHTIQLTDFEFCAGCAYIPYCTGNCPGLAYTLTGKVDHPSPDACLRRFLEKGGTIV
jgi:SynChlorMet cassette radical SAM/SPASM protein ScmE